MITSFKYLIFSFTNKAKLDLNISSVPAGSQCSIPGQDMLGFVRVYVRRYSLCKLNTASNQNMHKYDPGNTTLGLIPIKPVHEISNNVAF